jgi:hypothetical protein
MKISICFVLVLCCAAIVSAQEKVIDKSEFDALVASGNNHNVRWKDEKYRLNLTTSTKGTGRMQTDYSSKTIFEFASPTEKRTVTNSSFGGKPNPVGEAILIGKWKYTRSGNNPWTRKADEQESNFKGEAPEGVIQPLDSVAEYRYLGKENLAGRATDIYQKIEHQKKVNSKNGETMASEVKSTYWFGEDGALLKNEYRSETRSPSLTWQTIVIMEWTLDPSIVITEPSVTGDKP